MWKHEMIHAYLFVTHNNRDRDGHGPEFHKHMDRINKVAGTKITVFHTFHDEVRSYQQHWWKCLGPCQKRPPYFGMVRRAMNRAPGPSDFWWSEHQASCGGTYVKVREPEGYSVNKKGKGGRGAAGKGTAVSGNSNLSKVELPHIKAPKEPLSAFGSKGSEVKPAYKSGIYGYFSPSKAGSDQKGSYSVGLLGKSSSHSNIITEGVKATEEMNSTNKPFVPFYGKGHILGGATMPNFRQRLLFDMKGVSDRKKDSSKRNHGTSSDGSPAKRPRNILVPTAMDGIASSSHSKVPEWSSSDQGQLVKCPVCDLAQREATINAHLDECIAKQSNLSDDDVVCLDSPLKEERGKESWYLECPGCRERLEESEFDHHLNSCDHICGDEPPPKSSSQDDGVLSFYDGTEFASCPICGQSLTTGALGAHLETCLSSMSFDDEDDDWK